MPSGKTHDAVTFFLTAPAGAVAWKLTDSLPTALIVAVTFLIGGLMFGPDLDTMSKQYIRWGIFKSLWFPYQAFFKHRSRWSHGLIFGTFIRIVYFMGVLTLFSFLGVFLYETYTGGDLPNLWEFTKAWQQIGEYTRRQCGEYVFVSVFAGLWFGAASHTLTDMAGTYIKHGKIIQPL